MVPRGARQRRRTGAARKGTQRVINGYSKRVFQAAAKRLRVLAAVFVGYWWAVLGSVVSMAGHIGTYQALTGYSKSTRRYGVLTPRVLLGYPQSGELSPASAVRSDARARAATGRVLTGYS